MYIIRAATPIKPTKPAQHIELYHSLFLRNMGVPVPE